MKRGERCCCLITTRNSNSSTATKNRGIIGISGRAGQPRGRELLQLQQPLGNQQFAPRQLIENGSIQMEASLPVVFPCPGSLILLPPSHPHRPHLSFCLSVCLSDCLCLSLFLFCSVFLAVRVTDCRMVLLLNAVENRRMEVRMRRMGEKFRGRKVAKQNKTAAHCCGSTVK